MIILPFDDDFVVAVVVGPLGGGFSVAAVVRQLLLLQVTVSVSLNIPSSKIPFEEHKDPPACGNGLSQDLVLERPPPPQVKEH